MRAYFKNMIQAYSGECDGLVYYYNRRLNRVIARLYVKPKPTANTRRFGLVVANLKTLNPAQDFRYQLDSYVTSHNADPASRNTPMNNWYNAYQKMMWKLERGEWTVESGEPVAVDLTTITREFIYDNQLPCISVKRAVEAGLLPRVKGYELLTAEI